MTDSITLLVNGKSYQVEVDPETPLLYVLRNDLNLKGPKFGCGLEQCNACKVLVDQADVPSCQLPVKQVAGLEITTVEGLGDADNLHPLQEAFMAEQAIQCGYCVSGMVVAAQGLLNRVRYPTDEQIREALADNICRCGVYERVRRAIKMRIGRPIWDPIYEVIDAPPLEIDLHPQLPTSLQTAPELDNWLHINDGGTITIFTGKVEIGQGLKTAVAQIAAEELDVSLERIVVKMADTALTPDEGVTSGSRSLQTTGNAIRLATAEARHFLLALAHEELEAQTPAAELVVVDGTISDPVTDKSTTYWDLFAGRRFSQPITGLQPAKSPDQYNIVGEASLRLDLLPKVTGQPSFVHDLDLPGLVHGRVVRPPHYQARLVSVDTAAVERMPGVLKVVRDGSFLAVLAEREEQAVWAAERLKEQTAWENEANIPTTSADLYDYLRSQTAESYLVQNGRAVKEPIPSLEAGAGGDHHQHLTATYYRPYQMHGSLAPSAAVAHLEDGKLSIWSHSQAVFLLRGAVADVLGMAPADIRVIHMEGSGCYGHNGADDVALDAALLARALPGRPVSAKWMRPDEHGWEPYGAAMVVQVQADLDETGMVTAWHHDVWSYPHTTRPRSAGEQSGLLAAWHLEKPFPPIPPKMRFASHFGDYRNANPLYAFPQRRIVTHFVPASPLRTSAMRSLGGYANVFAIESFMDELAAAAGADPVEFRLKHLTDERAKAVIEAAANKAGWEPRTRPARTGVGRGIAFAQYKNAQCYAAIVVELHLDRTPGTIHLDRAIIAADAGQIVNPDGLSNQLEGGFVQATSWTLAEEVAFDRDGILSQDWDSYPLLRFSGVPVIETVLLNRPALPFLGSGEATQNPTPAAIANAIYDAAGIRPRQIPFTPARIKALLEEKGRQ
jgi:nicotinate dehydrogenase subunit B